MTPRILVAYYGTHQQTVISQIQDFGIRVPLDALDCIAVCEQRGKRFDMLVLDAEMPESVEAAEYARDLGWHASVVFVSTADDLGLRLRACAARCDAFIVLPKDLSQLKPLMSALLEGL
jgi:DNA-binding NarL/FixJ family response regulator